MLLPYLWTGVERWMLKSNRLVCAKNATVAQSVTNYNLDPSILIMKWIYQSFMGKICHKIPLPLRSYSGDLYQNCKNFDMMIGIWRDYEISIVLNFRTHNLEWNSSMQKSIWSTLWISYFTNPYRQLLLKLCCENNIFLCGILMLQKASSIDHPCSQIADYYAWSFLIYHGNMPQAILWYCCKGSISCNYVKATLQY